MTQDPGKQYDKDHNIDPTGFLAKARFHQSKYRAYTLNVPYDGHGNYLREQDALNGLNFYNDFDIFKAVKQRYPKYSQALYANMLRSEHIPFNLFIPFRADLDFGVKVFNNLLGNNILSIDRIKIEYAPSPAEKYLKDRTSFDAYIEYTHIDHKKGIIGIEVKYTEQAYPLVSHSKQERDILDKNSSYYHTSGQCGLYKPNTTEMLITDRFRQIWRNQLLGECILIVDSNRFTHFTSMTVFPEGNQHFVQTSKNYIKMLITNNLSFVPVTYEEFLEACRKYAPNERYVRWVDYLQERYIVD